MDYNYVLTYPVQHSPSSEANRFSASHESPHILWNPKAHYRIHKCPPPVPILSQLDPLYTPTPYFLRSYQVISRGPRFLLQVTRKRICYNGKELSARRPNPKLENHPLSAVRDCLFSIFAAPLHTAGRSFVRNLRTRHAVVTGTDLSRSQYAVHVYILSTDIHS